MKSLRRELAGTRLQPVRKTLRRPGQQPVKATGPSCLFSQCFPIGGPVLTPLLQWEADRWFHYTPWMRLYLHSESDLHFIDWWAQSTLECMSGISSTFAVPCVFHHSWYTKSIKRPILFSAHVLVLFSRTVRHTLPRQITHDPTFRLYLRRAVPYLPPVPVLTSITLVFSLLGGCGRVGGAKITAVRERWRLIQCLLCSKVYTPPPGS